MIRFLEAWKGTGAKDTLDRCQAEVHELHKLVDAADSLATKTLMEDKLKNKEREMRKAQAALAGREAMRHSTKVIELDGSRALRSKTTNCVTDFLSICATEQMSSKEIQAAFETYQGKAQAERDVQPGQEASQIAREEEEEYSWYTSQVRQRKRIIREGVGARQQMRPKEQTEIKQTENKLNTPQQQAPIFATFAGMDLLGMGLRKTFKAGKCVGGSEWNNSARKLFHREHGFDPFEDHEQVPDYAYKYTFMDTTGAPCVAFSRAGKRIAR